jgi:CrcB protein
MSEVASPFTLDVDIENPLPGLPPRPTLPHGLGVVVGGSVGTLLRYLVVRITSTQDGGFDWTILFINVVGSFILAILAVSLFERHADKVGFRLFLATGLLGGWTTYSAIIAGALLLTHLEAYSLASLTLLSSLALPPIAACVGLVLGSRLFGRKH